MNTTAAAAPAGQAYRPSLLSRLITLFSGPLGIAVKLVGLALLNALAVWAAVRLADQGKWVVLAVLVAATAAVDLIYAWPGRAIPAKFLVPGVIFLVSFQVVPIIYTVSVAFQNYSTGHVLTKGEAIRAIQQNSLQPADNGASYTMTPARKGDTLVLLLVDEATGATYAGTADGLEALPAGSATVKDGRITAAEGYSVVPGNELFSLDQQLQAYRVPTKGGAISPQGLDVAGDRAPTLRYDAAADHFVRIADGAVGHACLAGDRAARFTRGLFINNPTGCSALFRSLLEAGQPRIIGNRFFPPCVKMSGCEFST